MTDLFDYPHSAGAKVGGASIEAAQKIEPNAKLLRRRVVELFHKHSRWTPDEAAAALGCHFGDIRPRFSELSAAIFDRKTGDLLRPAVLRKTSTRRLSSRGNSQHVYELIGE